MSENAIDVNGVHVYYQPHGTSSIKNVIFKNKTKKEGKVHALRGVTFSVKKGKILGIIGKNGSGKSTLLRCLAGVFCADEGIIDLHKQKISLLSLGVGFKSELSGRENAILSGLLLGFTREEIEERIPSIIEFAEIGEFFDYPVKTYSSGMYSKLAFAVATTLETEILLIDEVLSVGDEKFRVRSYSRMRELIADTERTVVIVSHSISTLRELCTDVMWLNDGEIIKIGDPNMVLDEYVKYMGGN